MIFRDASLEHLVKIYVIKSKKQNISDKKTEIPYNLTCYAVSMFQSNIFVREEPAKAQGIQKYQILHEIGHTQFRMVVEDFSTVMGITPLIFYIFWILGATIWSVESLFAFICFIVVIILFREDRKRKIAQMRLNDEILADAFAISYLSEEDLFKVAANKYFERTIYDYSMTPLENAVRVASLRRNLEYALNDQTDRIITDLEDVFKPTSIAFLASSVLIIGALGLFTLPSSWWTLLWYGFLTIVLGVSFLFFFFSASVMEGMIENEIEKSKLMPQDS